MDSHAAMHVMSYAPAPTWKRPEDELQELIDQAEQERAYYQAKLEQYARIMAELRGRSDP